MAEHIKTMKDLIKYLVVITSVIILHFNTANAASIDIRKICKNNANNELSWSYPNNFCDGFICFYIYYREAGTTNAFTKLDSIFVITDKYTHLNANLGIGGGSPKSWEYYISMNYYCNGGINVLNSPSMTADETPPNSSHLDSVSVDPSTNRVYLGWQANSSSDFSFYTAYCYNMTVNPNFANTIDLFCIDSISNINPAKQSVKYEITANDSCGNKRAFGENPHSTIYLTSKYDSCNNSIRLTWTKYIGWNKVGSYTIFRKVDSYNWEMLNSTTGDSSAYTDLNAEKNHTYEYFVRATKDTAAQLVTSSSNATKIKTDGHLKSYDTYIATVTNKNGQVSVKFINDPKYYSSVELYKLTGNLKSLIKKYNGVNGSYIYFDNAGEILKQNSYMINTYDFCGRYSDSSQISGNIVTAAAQGDGYIQLNWNNYFTWNTGIESYQILRSSTGSKGTFANIGSTSGDTIFKDYVTLLNKQEMCYYILAIQNIGSAYGIDSSISNTVCIKGKTTLYLPNAINLNSGNNTFVIKGSNIDVTDVDFTVYNRWGIAIFHTNTLENGWKGVDDNGQKLESGTYLYELGYGENHKEKKTGSITILN